MSREKLGMSDSPMDMIVKLAEGNPGGLNVLMSLMTSEVHGFIHLLSLDDMNIRGSQIWIGFKDFAGEDLGKFKQAIKDRSQEMVDHINKVHFQEGGSELAVKSGASFTRR